MDGEEVFRMSGFNNASPEPQGHNVGHGFISITDSRPHTAKHVSARTETECESFIWPWVQTGW